MKKKGTLGSPTSGSAAYCTAAEVGGLAVWRVHLREPAESAFLAACCTAMELGGGCLKKHKRAVQFRQSDEWVGSLRHCNGGGWWQNFQVRRELVNCVPGSLLQCNGRGWWPLQVCGKVCKSRCLYNPKSKTPNSVCKRRCLYKYTLTQVVISPLLPFPLPFQNADAQISIPSIPYGRTGGLSVALWFRKDVQTSVTSANLYEYLFSHTSEDVVDSRLSQWATHRNQVSGVGAGGELGHRTATRRRGRGAAVEGLRVGGGPRTATR